MYAIHMRDVFLAMFGLTHALHTKLDNDFIWGKSGGERTWVNIAECTRTDPIICLIDVKAGQLVLLGTTTPLPQLGFFKVISGETHGLHISAE